MGRVSVAGTLTLVAALAAPARADETYRTGVRKWRDDRQERLTADGGWLTVVGLFWLKDGPNRFGDDPGGDIVLPKGSAPSRAGVFELKDGRTTLRLARGVSARIGSKPVSKPAVLRPDSAGTPDVVEMGALSMHVIERGGRHAIRLKDKNSPARGSFSGLKWFDVSEKYRIEAKWLSYAEPKVLRVPNVLGQTESMPSPGYAEFKVGRKRLRLDGVLEDPRAEQLFFIFRDQTSGKETYGAGRFLYADLPKGGKVVLDFNEAYNPPCAFTPYATCPLPPKENWLPVRIEAGEKAYGPANH